MAYNVTAEWRKGNKNDTPGALSHNPVLDPQTQDMLAEYDICSQPEMSIREISIIANDGHDSPQLQDLRRHVENDEEYKHLRDTILSGFPDIIASCQNH